MFVLGMNLISKAQVSRVLIKIPEDTRERKWFPLYMNTLQFDICLKRFPLAVYLGSRAEGGRSSRGLCPPTMGRSPPGPWDAAAPAGEHGRAVQRGFQTTSAK